MFINVRMCFTVVQLMTQRTAKHVFWILSYISTGWILETECAWLRYRDSFYLKGIYEYKIVWVVVWPYINDSTGYEM